MCYSADIDSCLTNMNTCENMCENNYKTPDNMNTCENMCENTCNTTDHLKINIDVKLFSSALYAWHPDARLHPCSPHSCAATACAGVCCHCLCWRGSGYFMFCPLINVEHNVHACAVCMPHTQKCTIT